MSHVTEISRFVSHISEMQPASLVSSSLAQCYDSENPQHIIAAVYATDYRNDFDHMTGMSCTRHITGIKFKSHHSGKCVIIHQFHEFYIAYEVTVH